MLNRPVGVPIQGVAYSAYTMDFSISGLASGFDWKTFVNSIMDVQKAPITKLSNDKTLNINKSAALADLDTKLAALKTATTALSNTDLFTGRKASSSTANSTWGAAAAAGTAPGNYKIAVTQLATVAHRDGASDVGKALNTSDDVSGLTIASLPTAIAISAGTFTVNGKKVTVALTDSLEQVFAAISTATGGDVTASYDHLNDQISLSSGPKIVLGAANDTSNFLTALHLTNNDSPTVVSTGTLGALNRSGTLVNARLKTAVAPSALDGAGNGSFTVNGVNIAYNLNTDSLDGVLQRVNKSGAGVTASYDAVADKVIFTNTTTGDTGIGVSEAAGGLLSSLGLTGASALTYGKNAKFSINGGATLISASNTLSESAHGIAGLSVTVDSEKDPADSTSTQTITVSGDTASMRSSIEGFISSFNEIQTYIADQSKITKTVDGKVSASLLSNNREVQSWSDSLRSIAFGAVPGLAGTISRLENLGIDFTTGTSKLAIKDGAKLDTALRDRASDVGEFFQTASTGLSAQMQTFLTKVANQNTAQQTQFTATNKGLDTQMETIQRRLDQQRALLTSSFIAMETAQSKLKSQSDALTRAFPVSTSK